jgi:beta-lactam-binding protein with PASTA domain
VTAKTGKVVKQSPTVGTSKSAGSKVALTLG